MATREDGTIPAAALEAIDAGRLIEAIKIVREATGLGLKEAKDVVEAHARRRRESRAHQAHGGPRDARAASHAADDAHARHPSEVRIARPDFGAREGTRLGRRVGYLALGAAIVALILWLRS